MKSFAIYHVNFGRSRCCNFLSWVMLLIGLHVMYLGNAQGIQTKTFFYTGFEQVWVVPPGVNAIDIAAYGAQGGEGEQNEPGGKGGAAFGSRAVTPGQTLYIYVGGKGESITANVISGGGFNGGGNTKTDDPDEPRGGGGGASDVRLGGNTFNDRIIVAGGGGGSLKPGWYGGGGGDLVGENGMNPHGNGGTGGTQTEPGESRWLPQTCEDGAFGIGGSAGVGGRCSGGGGGWYGGGAGGGAGSGYIGGVANGYMETGVRSGPGLVTFTYFTPYPNDICDDAILLQCGDIVSGQTNGAGFDNVVSCNGNQTNSSGGVWYSFMGTGNVVSFSTCNSGTDFNTQMSVYKGLCDELVCVAGNDDGPHCGGAARLALDTELGILYKILIHGANGEEGDFTITVDCDYHPWDDSQPLACGTSINSTTVGTPDPEVACFLGSQPAQSGAWFTFEGEGECVSLNTCASITDFDTEISVYRENGSNLNCVAYNDDVDYVCINPQSSQVDFFAEAGDTYYVLVHGKNGAEGDFNLYYTCFPYEPIVLTCPPNLTLLCGEDMPPIANSPEDFLAQGGLIEGGNCQQGFSVIWGYAESSEGDLCDGETITRIYLKGNDTDLNPFSRCTQTITRPAPAPPIVDCGPSIETVSCWADINPSISDVTVIADCGTTDVTISGPFKSNNITSGCPGAEYEVHYAVEDICDNTVVCVKRFVLGDQLEIACPPDRTVSCLEDVVPELHLLQVDFACGAFIPRWADDPVLLDGGGNCNGTQYGITYYAQTDCGELESCTQLFTIQNEGPQVNLAPDITVECADDIIANANDIQVTFPCGGFVSVQMNGPIIADPSHPNCSGNTYTYTYDFTDFCGNDYQYNRVFTIQNEGTQVSIAPNVTVECVDDVIGSEHDITVTRPCGELVSVDMEGPFAGDNTHPNCAGNTYTYRYTFIDECGFPQLYERVFTIQNEGIQVNVAPNEEVTCVENIIVGTQDIQVIRPCGESTEVAINGPVISNPSLPNCSGTTHTYTYSFADECGNDHVYSRVFTIENEALQIEAPADQTVACVSDIMTLAGDAVVTSTCNLNYTTISRPPELVEGLAGCSGSLYRVEYMATNICGATAIDYQYFTLQHEPMQLLQVDPQLENIENNSILPIDCYGQDDNWAIPQFNASAFIAPTACNGNADIDYLFEDLGAADCALEGYLHRYRYTWTATDDCGNTDAFSFILQIVDNTPPVLHGIPADITQDCAAAFPSVPEVLATDECHCANLTMSEEELSVDCEGNRVVVRTWTAWDCCGNTTEARQYITIKDETAPVIYLDPALGLAIEDGATIERSCGTDGQLWLSQLGEHSVLIDEACTAYPSVNFSLESTVSPSCASTGYVERHTAIWTATDDCGNTSTYRFNIDIIDEEAPEFSGSEVLYLCPDDEEAGFVTAFDNCSNVETSFTETPHESCDGVIHRTYEISDECGNTSLASQVVINLSQRPQLIELNPQINLEDMILECELGNTAFTTYTIDDVLPTIDCIIDLDITFSEILVQNSCDDGGMKLQLLWTASTPCGYTDSLVYWIDVMDNLPPYFPDFQSELNIACGAAMPAIIALDDCGAVELNIEENESNASCSNERIVTRFITATDLCGQTATAVQVVSFLDNEGPVFDAPAYVCVEEVSNTMLAYDHCSGNYIEASLVNEEEMESCQNLPISIRTWQAEDECGNLSTFVQTVYDAEISLNMEVVDQGLYELITDHNYTLTLSDISQMQVLEGLDDLSVVARDVCDNVITGGLTKMVTTDENCENGIGETHTYTWHFAEICGEVYEYSLSFDIRYDVAPQLDVEELINIYCTEELPDWMSFDAVEGVEYAIVVNDYRNEYGDGQVIRNITATDFCGNTTEVMQTINAFNTTDLVCAIDGDLTPACNSTENTYKAEVTGGTAPYTYEWTAVGGNCVITQVEGNAAELYIGFGQATLQLTVTDANGCVTTCETVISCLGTGFADTETGIQDQTKFEDANINVFPIPTTDQLNVDFRQSTEQIAGLTLFNSLGQAIIEAPSVQVDQGIYQLDTSNLDAGSYILKIKLGNRIFSKIVIIARL